MTEDRPYVMKVPLGESGKRDLLADRPPLWEYLLFANCMQTGLASTEEKYRDFVLRYTPQVGAYIAEEDLFDELTERLNRVQAMASNVEKVISADAQLVAFGAPGESGDPDMIEHMAKRLIGLYEGLLDWQSEVLALRLHAKSDIPSIGAKMARQPILAVREFVSKFSRSLEESIAAIVAKPGSDIVIQMPLTFEMEDGLVDAWSAELKRITAKPKRGRGW